MKRRRIRRDPTKSPFRLILNRIEKPIPPLVDEPIEIENEVEEPIEIENEEEKFVDVEGHVDRVLKVQTIFDEEEQDDKQFQLLKMIHLADIDAESVLKNLDITENELESMVGELVELGFLEFISGDEVIITEDGIDFIRSQDF